MKSIRLLANDRSSTSDLWVTRVLFDCLSEIATRKVIKPAISKYHSYGLRVEGS